jgi:hypothetical protein
MASIAGTGVSTTCMFGMCWVQQLWSAMVRLLSTAAAAAAVAQQLLLQQQPGCCTDCLPATTRGIADSAQQCWVCRTGRQASTPAAVALFYTPALQQQALHRPVPQKGCPCCCGTCAATTFRLLATASDRLCLAQPDLYSNLTLLTACACACRLLATSSQP